MHALGWAMVGIAVFAQWGIESSLAQIDASATPIAASADSITQILEPLTAGPIRAKSGQPLLPPGVRVDRSEAKGNVVHIDLTFPESAKDRVWTVLDAQEISEQLAAGIRSDLDFGGVVVQFRFGEDDAYASLDELATVDATAGQYPPLKEDAGAVLPQTDPPVAAPRSTTFANAGSQPSGALSGVVVYAAAGHGWTWNGSSWGLQRPLLLDMIEDYGNIEQLNYFVNYAFNAGATVVAFRPVGYQTEEIVIDQDDPQVTFTGIWSNSGSNPHYENGVTVSGISYRFAATSASETHTARYTPNITVEGFYPVYTWVLDSSNRTTQKYRINHSGGTTEVVVDHRMVGRGWVWLGSYYFETGTGGWVEISNESAIAGNVIADAIRFGNGIGDVAGSGGGISGFPRDEEAQRYWAESETGINAVGMPSSIYNCCSTDNSDNVGTAARWAREMNNTVTNNNRWQRIYLEFHSNASGGGARGTVALVTGNNTTNQNLYATILGDEIETDMLILDSGFEHPWIARSNPFNGSFGAISTTNNSNEFDATILEVAFHDNAQDAQLLIDPKVRDVVARSSVHGVIKFLNNISAGAIPLAFPPVTPENFLVRHLGNGDVELSWSAPATGEAFGDAATSYRVYRSSNGYGFDGGTDVGNVLTTTLSDIPVNTTSFLRVAAVNAAGESMPTETLAVRRGAAGFGAEYLIVNGFDRVSRQQDPQQTISLGTFRRPIARRVNSFDYTVQHGQALAAAGALFDSCSNEAVINGDVILDNYPAVVWISGEESTTNDTFDATEQTLVTNYLNGGGNIFVSGAEIAWDLDNLNNGQSFYNNQLKADYVGDDANTYDVTPAGGSIFDGIASFSFDDGALFYNVEFPDQIGAFGGSATALNYVGGGGGVAGVVFDGAFRVVNFGFPFETITSAVRRNEIMLAIVNFFNVSAGDPIPVEVIVESRDAGGAITAAPVYSESGALVSDALKSTVAGLSGTGSRYVAYDIPNAGSDNATFAPDLVVGGKYEVFLTWGADANCGDAQATITHRNGVTVSLFDQLPATLGIFGNTDRWVSLGEFWFDGGQGPSSVNLSEVTISGVPDGGLAQRMYVDAARWLPVRGLPNGDGDNDGDVDFDDLQGFVDCVSGPGGGYIQPSCEDFDFDTDTDVDAADFVSFQQVFTGP